MAGIERRIAALEAAQEGPRAYERPVYLSLHYKELENLERTEAGLEPIPLTPKEEAESREGARRLLEEYIPHLRRMAVSEESLRAIDALEENARRQT